MTGSSLPLETEWWCVNSSSLSTIGLVGTLGRLAASPLTHHNASVQVFSECQEKCRVVWIADLMPNEVADAITEIIQQGLDSMKQKLESNRAEA